jgi:hypothetical protein
MTDDRLAKPARKTAIIRRLGSLLLIMASTGVAVLLVEVFCYFFLPTLRNTESLYQAVHGVVLLDGRDTIFRDVEDIYTYIPHEEVRNVTGFFDDDGFRVEYDYRFRTNNLGLVQDFDVLPERDSLLLLGDSFTEGQGAEPWFRLVSSDIDQLGYQPINGGLLGTGFAQWLKLDRFLTDHNLRVRKVLVLFISDDYHRAVWNFTANDFRCLSGSPLCHAEESAFYRLPPREELPSWIAKVRAARAPMIKKIWREERAAALLPASYRVVKYFTNRALQARWQQAEQQSRAVIAELIKTYGPTNVAFLHLPQKNEIDSGPNDLGLSARRAIQEAGGRLFDGFRLCHLTVSDYYPTEGHPNSGGYGKIAACGNHVIRELVAHAQRS